MSRFAAITLFAALAIPVGLAAERQQQSRKVPHYKLTVFRTLGGTHSTAAGINNMGQLAGFSLLRGDNAGHAVLLTKGVITDLGSLQGGPLSTTFTNPNERGEVSGMSNTSTPDPNGEDFCFFGTNLICLGFLWRDRVLTAMPTLGGNNSLAYQVNNHEQVAGVAENTKQDQTCVAFNLEAKPVIWQKGTVEELPTIDGDPDGFGYGINDRGQVVGSSGTCNAQVPLTSVHAVLWPNGPKGGVIDLGNLGSTMWNLAFYINNQGQVVGQSGVPGGAAFHAFLWQNGVMTDLGTLPGDIVSWASDINSKGQAVGTSFPATGSRAFIWQNGVMTDLNTLIPAGFGFYLAEAFGINDRGQIAGFGLLPNAHCPPADPFCNQRAYLLTPCHGKQGNGEGCEEGGGENAVLQTSPAPPDVPSRPLPQSPMRRMNRYPFPGRTFGPRN
jgi:probable HAF family extracellular repeat protein